MDKGRGREGRKEEGHKEKAPLARGLSVLVTGGTGFIGGVLLRRLTAGDGSMLPDVDELAVSALVREVSTAKCSTFPKTVDARTAALDQISTLENAVDGVDVVVHLAAMMDFYPHNVDEMYKVNVEGTRNLLTAFARQTAERGHRGTFIYVSSTETLGGVDKPPGDEQTEPRPVYEYGKSKVEAEKVVREESERLGVDYIILRPTGVLGPGDFFTIFELMEMINSGLLCFIPGGGRAQLMYTHVDDVVQSIVKAIEMRSKCKNETFIICPDEALTYRRWIEIISEELGRAKPFLHLPFPVVRIATALLAPIMNRGKARTFMYQVDTVNRMSEDRVYSNAKARRLLGFKPAYDLESAIRQTVRYNLEKGHIKRHVLSPVALYSLCLLAFLILAWRTFAYLRLW